MLCYGVFSHSAEEAKTLRTELEGARKNLKSGGNPNERVHLYNEQITKDLLNTREKNKGLRAEELKFQATIRALEHELDISKDEIATFVTVWDLPHFTTPENKNIKKQNEKVLVQQIEELDEQLGLEARATEEVQTDLELLQARNDALTATLEHEQKVPFCVSHPR